MSDDNTQSGCANNKKLHTNYSHSGGANSHSISASAPFVFSFPKNGSSYLLRDRFVICCFDFQKGLILQN